MSAAGYAADALTARAVEAAGWMLLPAMVFPPTEGIGMLLGVGKGAPGTVAEGSASWQGGAAALRRARDDASSLVAAMSADEWSGADRALFDAAVQDHLAQLDTAAGVAGTVGGWLEALAIALAPWGGVCLAIGGVMMAEGLAFEAAVASVVGDLGASEAIYAEACAVGSACLAVLATYAGVLAELMTVAAGAIQAGAVGDARDQQRHGDTDAVATLGRAEVDGLGEVAENLEGLAVGLAGDALAGKATEGMPAVTTAERAIKKLLAGGIAGAVDDENSAVVDGVKGEGPLRVLEDLTGVSDRLDAVDRLLDDGRPDVEQRDDVEYALPPTPPALPVVPIPPATDDDAQVVPVSSDINGGTVRPA